MNELSFYEGYLEGKRRQDEVAKRAKRKDFYTKISQEFPWPSDPRYNRPIRKLKTTSGSDTRKSGGQDQYRRKKG
jgi:hypothetical protein